jgi:hypothetical protein
MSGNAPGICICPIFYRCRCQLLKSGDYTQILITLTHRPLPCILLFHSHQPLTSVSHSFSTTILRSRIHRIYSMGPFCLTILAEIFAQREPAPTREIVLKGRGFKPRRAGAQNQCGSAGEIVLKGRGFKPRRSGAQNQRGSGGELVLKGRGFKPRRSGA